MHKKLRRASLRRYGFSVLILVASSAWPAVFVDRNDPTCSDAVGAPYCELAPAITDASSGETIVVAAGVYPLSNIDLLKDVRIVGAGSDLTFLDGGNAARLFTVSLGAHLELVDLTARNGAAPDTGGCFDVYAADLTLNSCVVTGCTALTSGGAIYASDESEVEVLRTMIAGNSAGTGGGLSVSSPGTLRMVNSAVISNSATVSGGGVMTSATLEITNLTVAGNAASAHGGGMYVSAPATGVLANLTVASNQADFDDSGGGVGGGIRFDGVPAAMLRNSIIADNSVGSSGLYPDCSGTMASGGYNLIGLTAGCTVTGDTTGNLIAVVSNLLPLEYNGGPTPTKALDSGSYALDAGNPAGCLDGAGNLRVTDQRGFPSPEESGDGLPGVACDMGAYEVSSCFFADGFESSSTSGWTSSD